MSLCCSALLHIEDETEPDGYYYMYGGADNETTLPVVVLKDNSHVKVEAVDGEPDYLPAGYADALIEYALDGYTSAGVPIINHYDPVNHPEWPCVRESPVIKSGSVSQLFTPADGKTVILYGGEAYTDWVFFVLESDAEAFKVKKETPPKRDGLALSIYDQGETEPMGYTVRNNGTKTVTGCYALLSYWPVTAYYAPTVITPEENEVFYGQILPLDVDLAPGENMRGVAVHFCLGLYYGGYFL